MCTYNKKTMLILKESLTQCAVMDRDVEKANQKFLKQRNY